MSVRKKKKSKNVMSIQIPLWALVGPLCIEEEIKGTQKQERDFMLRL